MPALAPFLVAAGVVSFTGLSLMAELEYARAILL